MTSERLIAYVRCPWCGTVAAEVWADGANWRLVGPDDEHPAVPGTLLSSPPSSLAGFLGGQHPWCTAHGGRWSLRPSARRRLAELAIEPAAKHANIQAARVS